MSKKAIIVGTSGLIGSKLLDVILHEPNYSEISIFVRKKSKYTSKKLTTVIVDFSRLEDFAPLITGDALFCCLGSTRQKTPHLDDYRKVDHDYPLQLAQIAAKNGVKQYHLVSSIGANANGKNFYTKMKGETEEDIKNVGMPCLHIYQPSFLTGKRKERRTAERILAYFIKVIDPLLFGSLKKYKSIPAMAVARFMYKQSLKTERGVFVHTSDKMHPF